MDTKKTRNKNVVFLDDCRIYRCMLINGLFQSHDLAKDSALFAFLNINDFFDFVDNKENQIDLFVIDYHFKSISGDGLDIIEILSKKRPNAQKWMFTGMSADYIIDKRLNLVDRFIHKDDGVLSLFDQIAKWGNVNDQAVASTA